MRLVLVLRWMWIGEMVVAGILCLVNLGAFDVRWAL